VLEACTRCGGLSADIPVDGLYGLAGLDLGIVCLSRSLSFVCRLRLD